MTVYVIAENEAFTSRHDAPDEQIVVQITIPNTNYAAAGLVFNLVNATKTVVKAEIVLSRYVCD